MVDIKSQHIPVQMPGMSDAISESNKNIFQTFSTINVTDTPSNSSEKKN